ncbi:hypothetical protein BDQ17DRAFT_1329332 [Cyathus striatus]|nr:hypothetical protein BDQ17DRAFT_1329332 [Cyathus striatus]
MSPPKPTPEDLLRNLLSSAQTDLLINVDKVFLFKKTRHVNLEENTHPKVGDYGFIGSDKKFVREGNIFDPVDGSVIPTTPGLFHGLQIDKEFMRAVKNTHNSKRGSGCPVTELEKKGINVVFLKGSTMAPLAREVFEKKAEKPVWQSSILRHLLPEIVDERGFEEAKVQESPPSINNNFVVVHEGWFPYPKIFVCPSDADHRTYIRKSSAYAPADMVFFNDRKRIFMNDKLQNALRKVRPDLKGKVIITSTTSCNGYLVFYTKRRAVTGIDVHILKEETNPANPTDKWRDWKILGDGLLDAVVWDTMPSGPVTNMSDEKEKCKANKRRTLFYETLRI